MSKIVSFVSALLRPLMLVGVSVALLAACANPEKSDLTEFGRVMQEVGYTQQTHQQFQTRIAAAQSEEEMRAVLDEMFAIFEVIPPKLDAIAMKSDEVRKVRDDFSAALRDLLTSSRSLMELNAADPAAMEQAAVLQKNMMEAQTRLIDAQSRLMNLAGKHGLEIK